MKIISKLTIVACASVFALSGCKKTDSNAVDLTSDGSINGTLVGNTILGRPLNISFNFSNLEPGFQYSNTVQSDTIYNRNNLGVVIEKIPMLDFYINLMQSNFISNMDIYFTVNPKNNKPVLSSIEFDFSYSKPLTGDSVLNYSVNNSDLRQLSGGGFDSTSVSITNYVYNASTGKVSGSFTFYLSDADNNNVQHKATLSGTFSTIVYKKTSY
jgi:hypothetical protein